MQAERRRSDLTLVSWDDWIQTLELLVTTFDAKIGHKRSWGTSKAILRCWMLSWLRSLCQVNGPSMPGFLGMSEKWTTFFLVSLQWSSVPDENFMLEKVKKIRICRSCFSKYVVQNTMGNLAPICELWLCTTIWLICLWTDAWISIYKWLILHFVRSAFLLIIANWAGHCSLPLMPELSRQRTIQLLFSVCEPM